MKTESPSDQPPSEPAPAAEEEPAWWTRSEPAQDTVPPKSQMSEMGPAAVTTPASAAEIAGAEPSGPDDEPPPPPEPDDESERPTAPYATITQEQISASLEARADAPTPPGGTPVGDSELSETTRKLESDSAPAVSTSRSRQGLAVMAARDIGRIRELNQDSVFAMLTTLPRESAEMSAGLFVVADGMGGHHGGEVASRLAVRTVVHHVLSQLVLPALDERLTEALQPMLISAVQAANEAIWDSAQVLGSDMGTTCTTALLLGGSLYVAHVGDSRAYLFEPGGMRQLTTDHSTVGRLIQLGQLDPSEAREHPLRNQLYRTVGQQPQVLVDFVYQPVGQASHLLLCSDGLWGLVDEAMMAQALARSPWPEDACNELVALANLAGGDDNISVVVVTLPLIERY